jgi:hypothetical protein
MHHDSSIIDLIERAHDASPFCACGSHTTPVYRDGTVWLECATLGRPSDRWIGRVVAAVTSPMHTRTSVVEVPATNLAA